MLDDTIYVLDASIIAFKQVVDFSEAIGFGHVLRA